MSVQNFNGDGYGDTSGLVYGFESNQDEIEIRKIVRSGFGHARYSPGDIHAMSSTTSALTDELPAPSLPGGDDTARDDCGDPTPAFYCSDCANSVYVGRTCRSPSCGRCSASAIKYNTISKAGKLDGLRRDLYCNKWNENKNVDFQHVIASPPDDFVVDSESPIEHTYKIIKVILEKQWHVEGFLSIYHPYRIKDEYRKDQYDHPGAKGQGDMTWADVLNADDPMTYLKFEPHFHLFFPLKRRGFDYSVTEYVENRSGWVFHRVEKPQEDDNKSVTGMEDLTHQLCYCYSHCPVIDDDGESKFASRMKGDLHNAYAPDDAVEQATAAFCKAAPRLLGVSFKNTAETSCDAENCDCEEECTCEDDHPIRDLYNEWDGDSMNGESGSMPTPWQSASSLESPDPTLDDNTSGLQQSHTSLRGSTSDIQTVGASVAATTSAGDNTCDGELRPIREAQAHLNDDEWCKQARYAESLQMAYDEWRDRVDDDDEVTYGTAVQR